MTKKSQSNNLFQSVWESVQYEKKTLQMIGGYIGVVSGVRSAGCMVGWYRGVV